MYPTWQLRGDVSLIAKVIYHFLLSPASNRRGDFSLVAALNKRYASNKEPAILVRGGILSFQITYRKGKSLSYTSSNVRRASRLPGALLTLVFCRLSPIQRCTAPTANTLLLERDGLGRFGLDEG